ARPPARPGASVFGGIGCLRNGPRRASLYQTYARACIQIRRWKATMASLVCPVANAGFWSDLVAVRSALFLNGRSQHLWAADLCFCFICRWSLPPCPAPAGGLAILAAVWREITAMDVARIWVFGSLKTAHASPDNGDRDRLGRCCRASRAAVSPAPGGLEHCIT